MLVYYGKLPAFGDFIRYNATGPEIQALDQWMQEAIYFSKRRLQPNADLAFKRAPLFHFFLSFKGSMNYLTGIIKPSRDKVGRIYPFMVGMLCNESVMGRNCQPFLPVVFQSFYDQVGRFIDDAYIASTSDEVYERAQALQTFIQSMKPDDDESFRSYVQSTSVNEYLSSVLEGDPQTKKNLLFKNLVDMSQYIINGDIHSLDFGFRFPLQPSPESLQHSVSFWIRLFFSWIGNRDTQPYAFWGAGDSHEVSNLYLFFRQPSPHTFTYMIQSKLATDLIYRMDVDGGSSSVPPGEKIPPHIKNILGSGDSTLNNLLQSTLT